MNKLWADFVRYLARQSKVGSVRALDGLEAAWVNSALPFCNGTFFTSVPGDAAELARRLEAAKADAAAHGLPWAVFTYDPEFAAVSIPEDSGFGRVMSVRVMTGEVPALAGPVRPLPAVEYRRISDDAGASHALELNLDAYGMPRDMLPSILESGAFFRDPVRDFGYVAYVDGAPVSTTTVVSLEGWLYVALVATAPGAQKKGYAEAVMRHALEQASAATGVTRTSLDATEAGAPVYRRMGYGETGETWTMWMTGH